MAIFSSLWRASRPTCSSVPSIMTLPDELLLEIASYLQRPSTDSSFSLPCDLVSLSSTCHLFNDISSRLILQVVHITSAKRLLSLASLPKEKLCLIRSLSVHFDLTFFVDFALSLDPTFRSSVIVRQPPHISSPPLIQVLCSILVATPILESLSLRLTRAPSQPSAWKHLASRSHGLSLSTAFEANLETHSISWPHLTHLHLEALQDVRALLERAPALSHLSLRMVEGFDANPCSQFLADIKAATPNLKHLALSPKSLHIPGGESTGVELLREIGQTCSELESLDLSVYAYGQDGLPALSVYNHSSPSDLISALSHFPSLQTLQFPGSLLDEEEMDALSMPSHEVDLPRGKDAQHPLHRVECREIDAVSSMAAVAPRLNKFSWLRRTTSGPEEHLVTYEVVRRRSDITSAQLSQSVLAEPSSKIAYALSPKPRSSFFSLEAMKHMLLAVLCLAVMASGITSLIGSVEHAFLLFLVVFVVSVGIFERAAAVLAPASTAVSSIIHSFYTISRIPSRILKQLGRVQVVVF